MTVARMTSDELERLGVQPDLEEPEERHPDDQETGPARPAQGEAAAPSSPTPEELAAQLKDSKAEVAKLRGDLERAQRFAQTQQGRADTLLARALEAEANAEENLKLIVELQQSGVEIPQVRIDLAKANAANAKNARLEAERKQAATATTAQENEERARGIVREGLRRAGIEATPEILARLEPITNYEDFIAEISKIATERAQTAAPPRDEAEERRERNRVPALRASGTPDWRKKPLGELDPVKLIQEGLDEEARIRR